MPRKTIEYAVHQEDGHIISRVGSEVAVPVLEYDLMNPENSFTATYVLLRFPVHVLGSHWSTYTWTRKVPTAAKNEHRRFWGLPELKEK